MQPPSLQAVLDRFAACQTTRERLTLLLSMGRELPPMKDEFKVEATLVPGCQSVVHIRAMWATPDNDEPSSRGIIFEGSSDAQLVKGMVALLLAGLNGLTPAEIAAIEPTVLKESGLGQSLVPGRANGLFNILQRMKDEAARLQEEINCDTTGTSP